MSRSRAAAPLPSILQNSAGEREHRAKTRGRPYIAARNSINECGRARTHARRALSRRGRGWGEAGGPENYTPNRLGIRACTRPESISPRLAINGLESIWAALPRARGGVLAPTRVALGQDFAPGRGAITRREPGRLLCRGCCVVRALVLRWQFLEGSATLFGLN